MKSAVTRLAAAMAVGLLGVVQPAAAQSPKSLLDNPGNSGACTVKEDGGMACYIAGKPDDTAPDNVKHGAVWLLVTHRPYRQVENEVSIYIGYPLQKDSKVKVVIDGQTSEMISDGEIAWAPDASADLALTKAMRSGLDMVVRGVSARGTNTTDRYSLRGFTRAHGAINQACGVKFGG